MGGERRGWKLVFSTPALSSSFQCSHCCRPGASLLPFLVPPHLSRSNAMEPDTATEAATVAASDTRATIVVIEDEQPGPSTFKEEGAAAAATEATTATEKGEKKKEVNRKGVCARALCVLVTSCAWPLIGAQILTFWRRQVPAITAGMGAAGRQNQLAFPPLPLSCRLPAGRGRGRARARQGGGVSDREPQVSSSPGPPHLPGTGGTVWGMGLCRKKPPPLPFLAYSPTPLFPWASAWEIWALQSHHR